MAVVYDLFEEQKSELEKAFEKFHAENPHIYQLFKQFTFQVTRTRDHYAVAAIWERIRWHLDVETNEAMRNPDDESRPLKLNNNHKAYYVRLFEADYPEYKGFFRTRKLTSKE